MAEYIILNGVIARNEWSIAGELPLTGTRPQKIVLPLELWNKHCDSLSKGEQIPGLLLNSHEHPADFKGDLKKLPVILIAFPAFTDGRGFSLGSLIRQRYGYQGELRAYGSFIRDQLNYLKRCGFNSFEFESPIDLAEAAKSLGDFTEAYQASSDQPMPLFRRRNSSR